MTPHPEAAHNAELVRTVPPCTFEIHNIAYSLGVGWYCPHCLSRLVLGCWYRPIGYALIDGSERT